MILYDQTFHLYDYEKLFSNLQKEYLTVRVLYAVSRVVLFFYIALMIFSIGIIGAALFRLYSRWFIVPIILFLVMLFSTQKIKFSNRENSFSAFISKDYKADMRSLRDDMYTVSYYIQCLKTGEIVDPARSFISAE